MADASPFEDFEDADAGAFEDAGAGAAADEEFGYEEAAGGADDAGDDPFGMDAGQSAQDDAAEDGGAAEDDEEDPFGGGGAEDADLGFGASAAAPAEEEPAAAEPEEEEEEQGETPLSLWKEERAKVLAERQSAAEAAREAQEAKAREEIEEFYKQREETLQKNMAAHRTDEAEAKAEHDALMENGTDWEKVAKQVNLKPPAGTKGGDAGKNARMRKLLLQLKQDKK